MKRICKGCEIEFESEVKSQRYCTFSCRNKAQKQRKIKQKGDWRTTPVICGVCEKEFIRGENSSPIRKYCSDECSAVAQNRLSEQFKKDNPQWLENYKAKKIKKYGKDTLINRLRKKYSDLPNVCEVPECNEGRVLDIAHKPEYARNGAYRVMKYYERFMFWILCPTHHAIIDRGVLSPKEISLE